MVDASAVCDTLTGAPRSHAYARLIEGPDLLHVPELCDLEVAAFVRELVLRGNASGDVAGGLLASYFLLPLERHSHTRLLRRVLSLWANFTAYDAVYVALAEELGAPLLTLDARLAHATRAHTSVEVLTP